MLVRWLISILCFTVLTITAVTESCKHATTAVAPDKVSSPPKVRLELKFNTLGMQVGMELAKVEPALSKSLRGGISHQQENTKDAVSTRTYYSGDHLVTVTIITDKKDSIVTGYIIKGNISPPTTVGAVQANEMSAQAAGDALAKYGATGMVFLGWDKWEVEREIGPPAKVSGASTSESPQYLYYANDEISVQLFLLNNTVCKLQVESKQR
jgi:hypothetical protein